MSSKSSRAISEHWSRFRAELNKQRWDDHRYYHHSRINQSLHLLSASCFILCYALIFISPGAAGLLGWVVAMCSRQAGHFFFEPKTYDEVNQATHEHKEDIKVGYNLQRKRILQGVWAITPLVLYVNPGFFGVFKQSSGADHYFQNLMMLWIWLALFALVARTVQLFFIRDVQTGLVWASKILTDPINDFKIYLKSPLYLARGELIDPMIHVGHETADDEQERPTLATGSG